MANPRWTSTSSTSFTTAANYDSGSAPANSDNVYASNNAIDIATNLSNPSLTPASLNVDMSYTGKIGTSTLGSGYLQTGSAIANVGTGTGSGSGRVKLDMGSTATTVFVYNSKGTSADLNLPPVRLLGTSASNKFYQLGGSVGWAVEDEDETSTLSEFSIDAGTLLLGAGVTWTTGYQTGGAVTVNKGGTTFTQQAGSLLVNSGIIATLTAGGSVTYNGRQSTLSVTAITRTSSTATATTSTNHGYATGDTVRIMGAVEAGFVGYKSITVTGATTFTFTCAADDVTPATGTMTCRRAIASLTIYGTVDFSGDIRSIDVATVTLGPNAAVICNRALPSHLNIGTLLLSNAGRLAASA